MTSPAPLFVGSPAGSQNVGRMFWTKARRLYGHLTSDDPEIQRYLKLVRPVQEEGGGGLAEYFENLGRRWVVAHTPQGRVLEIGAGVGRHARLNQGHVGEYFVSEFQSGHLENPLWKEFRGRAIQCDASRLPFRGGWFDGVVSTYSLEHMRRLKDTLGEIARVLKPGGRLVLALPCEGGFLWNLGREILTRRAFQKEFGLDYDKIIAYEHVHDLASVKEHLRANRDLVQIRQRFFPLVAPQTDLNLIACFSLEKRS